MVVLSQSICRGRATKSNDGSIPPVLVALRLPLAKQGTQKEEDKKKGEKRRKKGISLCSSL